MKIDAWSITDIGLVRKSNQDAVGCFPELSLFVVADGLGGHADGEVASNMAVALLREFFLVGDGAPRPEGKRRTGIGDWLRRVVRWEPHTPASDGKPPPLDTAVALVNRRIYETGQANAAQGNDRPLGTTLVVLKLGSERAYWAHVGDSRLYRLRDGTLQLLTADHTIHGERYRGQPVIPTDIQHTNKLLQAVGVSLEVDVATGSDGLCPGDLFLLCSDGVSGLVSSGVIREQLTASATAEVAGRNLIRLSREAGGRDNASVVVVKLDDAQRESTVKSAADVLAPRD